MKKPCGEEGKENCTVQGFIFGIEFTLLFSPGAYVVNESPLRLSGCKGATYINVLRGHQGT